MKFFFTAVVAAMLSVAVAFTPAAVRPNTRVVSSRTASEAFNPGVGVFNRDRRDQGRGR